jgi:hypothetical protein
VNKRSIIDLCKEKESREILIDTLCQGISNVSEFRDAVNYVMDNIQMFNIEEFKSQLYEDEDDYLDLILPTFRRVWGRVYTQPPPLFKSELLPLRLELYKLNFDIDEFLNYLKKSFIESKGCLNYFEHIDRTHKHLELIVDNYISLLVSKTLICDDYKESFRELKLKRLLK